MSSADLVVVRFAKEYELGGSITPRAIGTLTSSGNPAAADTVTINSKVYTFETSLTNVDGHVKVGATAADTLVNLMHAINLVGGVAGTDYAAATTAHPTVAAVSTTSTTLLVRAKTGGTAGNALTTTESSTALAWGGATLAGGAVGPALSQVRFTGESLNYNIQNTKTAEIRPDRAETDLVQTQASAAGSINMELSFDTFKEWLAGVFCSTWGAAGGGGEQIVENGIQRASYLIQKHFQDMDVPQYHNFDGCVAESLDLKMEIGKIVEGSFGFMGLGNTPTSVQYTGATFVDPPATTPMNAVSNVQDFSIAGVPYTGCLTKLGLNIKNNVRAIQCIGSLKARDMKLGTLEVTGDAEFHFNEGSVYENFTAGTEFALSFHLNDEDTNDYFFELPRCKFESGEVVAGGRNSDVMFTSKFRALYDATETCVIRLTGNPAP
jgi:hypothetical protein